MIHGLGHHGGKQIGRQHTEGLESQRSQYGAKICGIEISEKAAQSGHDHADEQGTALSELLGDGPKQEHAKSQGALADGVHEHDRGAVVVSAEHPVAEEVSGGAVQALRKLVNDPNEHVDDPVFVREAGLDLGSQRDLLCSRCGSVLGNTLFGEVILQNDAGQ